MPGIDSGANAGVSGLLSFSTTSPAKFAITAAAWSAGLSILMLPAGGDGDGRYTEQRPIGTTGDINVSGKVRVDAYPMPTVFRGEAGTLTLQLTTNITTAYPVMVQGVKYVKSAKDSGLWDVTFSCRVTGEPTTAGFGGSQPAAATVNYADNKRLWDGSSQTFDPNTLQNVVVRRYLCNAPTANEAADYAVAGAVFEDTAPPTGMKFRTATFTRVSSLFGFVAVQYGLTDTAEDVVNPRTSTTIDPQGLGSRAGSAAIGTTPATPTGATFVNRGLTTQELNDAKELQQIEWGLRSRVDDVQMPGTTARLDPLAVASEGRKTSVYTTTGGVPSTPAVPSAELQVVATRTEEINPQKSLAEWTFDVTNSHQKLEYPDTRTVTDPNDLESAATAADVFPNASPPSAPSTPAGLKPLDFHDVPVTPTQSKRVWRFAKRDTADDVNFPHRWTEADPNALRSRGEASAIDGAPGVPAGYKQRASRDVVLTDDHAQTIVTYALTDTADDEVFPDTWTDADPNALDSRGRAAALNGTPAVPSGYKARGTRSVQLTDDVAKSVTEYGLRDTVDDVNFPATRSTGRPWEGLSHEASVVVASILSASSLALSYVEANEGTLTYDGVEVRPLVDGKFQVVIRTKEDNVTVEFEMREAGRRLVSARLDADGDVVFYVRQCIKLGTNLYDVELAEQPYYGSLMRFWVIKRTLARPLPMFWDLVDPPSSNDADFLGLATGKVHYVGVHGRANLSNDSAAEIAYEFDYDSLGIIDLKDGSPGWYQSEEDLSAVTPRTWVKASTLGLTSDVVDGADYSGFIP